LVKQHGKHFVLTTGSNSHIIVDSGATNNMFSLGKLLSKTQSLSDYPNVTVANGVLVPTCGTGRARIFSKEIDVVIVPDLKVNLLSISKCTNQWNYNVIFTSQKVTFQDRDSEKMIDEGKQIDGLYVIEPSLAAIVSTNSKRTSSQLWHKRLGHPSDRVLEHLNLFLIHDFNKCDICQFAKFHRLSFPEHSDKSNEIFGLIHSDVWTAPLILKKVIDIL
jgi:GAG-pre-integrase domain